jgi:hypothetical protein
MLAFSGTPTIVWTLAAKKKTARIVIKDKHIEVGNNRNVGSGIRPVQVEERS